MEIFTPGCNRSFTHTHICIQSVYYCSFLPILKALCCQLVLYMYICCQIFFLCEIRSHNVLVTFKFFIFLDCDDLNVGEVLKFTIHCYAYAQNKQQIPICKDDNDGLSYQVNCTPKLNVWAAKAAQELKNFAPTANRNNCFHNNDSNSETVTKNSV